MYCGGRLLNKRLYTEAPYRLLHHWHNTRHTAIALLPNLACAAKCAVRELAKGVALPIESYPCGGT